MESSSFSFDVEAMAGYPPIPTQFTWFINGASLVSNSHTNVSVYPLIVFSFLNRTQSGTYSMTASNEGGTTLGFFVLNVTCKSSH